MTYINPYTMTNEEIRTWTLVHLSTWSDKPFIEKLISDIKNNPKKRIKFVATYIGPESGNPNGGPTHVMQFNKTKFYIFENHFGEMK